MRTIFLADAHLKGQADDNYQRLLRFLDDLAGNTDSLYIMGDLFDFWVGFPSHPFSQYDKILDALERLVASGCRLVCFEGNHDFHLGDIFSIRLKAEIHRGPVIKEIQGRRLYLCHGDQINRADYRYRFLRLLLHNPLTEAAVRFFPPAFAISIKEKLQMSSQSKYHVALARWDYKDIIRKFAVETLDKGCSGLVTGHFHIAFCEKLNNTAFTILSLGDWMEQFTYGELLDGELHLKKYHSF
ncbi:MAG: UDP-2,3-diacylglucosamine diphosphatase [Deltaproteobacteria bacterium]|nr:UDP-2,3-diacylglucosamine diphosphatase [Deltaproteobacteria bacterium]